MKTITLADVNKASLLARIKLTDEETTAVVAKLQMMVDSVEVLNDLDTSKVEITAHSTGLKNKFREDEVRPSLSQKDALMNSKNVKSGYFVVKKTIDKE